MGQGPGQVTLSHSTLVPLGGKPEHSPAVASVHPSLFSPRAPLVRNGLICHHTETKINDTISWLTVSNVFFFEKRSITVFSCLLSCTGYSFVQISRPGSDVFSSPGQ